MIALVALISILLFLVSFEVARVVPVSVAAIATAKRALGVIRDPSLDDEAREKAAQRASIQLFGAFASILLRSLLAVAAAFVPIYLADALGLAETEHVLTFLARWEVIVGASVVICAFVFAKGHVAAAAVNDYSRMDRLVHKLAFASPTIQFAAADIEKIAFRSFYAGTSSDQAIFITSLPRAGTTVMLEALSRLPTLAAHVYRDMPFVMAPVLWSRLSGGFRKRSELRERAHGDGVQIGYDSPEAFEEVIWRTFWPEKYARDGIALWDARDANDDAAAFLREHMQKIIALRCQESVSIGRYISKNNANVARLDWIPENLPGARILVPVRKPLEHAASLLRQHLNFLEVHRQDPFARRYMADIGHYEFGELHRPICFPGLADLLEGRNPARLDYWLAYWIAAFEYILTKRESVIAVSYEATCAGGPAAWTTICEQLALDPGDQLAQIAGVFRSPTTREVETTPECQELLPRAEHAHACLVGAG